eukprot:TRINITY_DN17836_c0_g1_i1.p1 TRINITY_DN17836_c0_g1~~TRINITY_DN17836_c0_g1_i1.p1  ORF type:complete len:215 (+),score=61.67 TRINITY_DN17836_c0_g1_i1:435-1079(+)
MVMDLVSGAPDVPPDLFSWLTHVGGDWGIGERSCTMEEVATIVHHIAVAIAYLKDEMGALHRDLKPENVLVGEDGIDHLKVTDFGLARLGVDSHLQATFQAGTEGYTAPEILDQTRKLGNGTIDYGNDPHKIDVFSLGVIAYIAISKTPPFGLGPGASTNVLQGKYKMDGACWAKVPAGAKFLVRKMLEHKQADRFSIEQVLDHPWLRKMMQLP